MDIRNFFKKRKLDESLNGLLCKTNSLIIETNSTSTVDITDLSKGGSVTEQVENVSDKEVAIYKNDIGNYLTIVNIDDDVKFDILCNPWVPSTSYNFKNDLKLENGRPFRHIWLEENNTWLSYSAIEGIKGAFCRVCVLFKPNVHRGIQGGFIIKPFTKYKDFHACCRSLLSSQWRLDYTTRANDFLNVMKGNKLNVLEFVFDEKE